MKHLLTLLCLALTIFSSMCVKYKKELKFSLNANGTDFSTPYYLDFVKPNLLFMFFKTSKSSAMIYTAEQNDDGVFVVKSKEMIERVDSCVWLGNGKLFYYNSTYYFYIRNFLSNTTNVHLLTEITDDETDRIIVIRKIKNNQLLLTLRNHKSRKGKLMIGMFDNVSEKWKLVKTFLNAEEFGEKHRQNFHSTNYAIFNAKGRGLKARTIVKWDDHRKITTVKHAKKLKMNSDDSLIAIPHAKDITIYHFPSLGTKQIIPFNSAEKYQNLEWFNEHTIAYIYCDESNGGLFLKFFDLRKRISSKSYFIDVIDPRQKVSVVLHILDDNTNELIISVNTFQKFKLFGFSWQNLESLFQTMDSLTDQLHTQIILAMSAFCVVTASGEMFYYAPFLLPNAAIAPCMPPEMYVMMPCNMPPHFVPTVNTVCVDSSFLRVKTSHCFFFVFFLHF